MRFAFSRYESPKLETAKQLWQHIVAAAQPGSTDPLAEPLQRLYEKHVTEFVGTHAYLTRGDVPPLARVLDGSYAADYVCDVQLAALLSEIITAARECFSEEDLQLAAARDWEEEQAEEAQEGDSWPLDLLSAADVSRSVLDPAGSLAQHRRGRYKQLLQMPQLAGDNLPPSVKARGFRRRATDSQVEALLTITAVDVLAKAVEEGCNNGSGVPHPLREPLAFYSESLWMAESDAFDNTALQAGEDDGEVGRGWRGRAGARAAVGADGG